MTTATHKQEAPGAEDGAATQAATSLCIAAGRSVLAATVALLIEDCCWWEQADPARLVRGGCKLTICQLQFEASVVAALLMVPGSSTAAHTGSDGHT